MIIKTDRAIISHREKITHKIANFWNKTSDGSRKIWGPHIHHGYYESNQAITAQDAQERLIEKLAEMLEKSWGAIQPTLDRQPTTTSFFW